MSRKNRIYTKIGMISIEEDDDDKIKEFFIKMTDDEFNGKNGVDMFNSVEVDGVIMSRLDAHLLKDSRNVDWEDYVNIILRDNYSDKCYKGFEIAMDEIVDINNEEVLIFSLSYVCY